MRFRLLHYHESNGGAVGPGRNMWKPVGTVRTADTPEEALRAHDPVAGKWLLLCEDDHTWRIFYVKKRTETDIEPADSDAAEISTAVGP